MNSVSGDEGNHLNPNVGSFMFRYNCQLTEDWGETLFSALKRAGGHAFSNMAVGYNNVDVEAATRNGISVGNTPVSFLTYFAYIFPLMFPLEIASRSITKLL